MAANLSSVARTELAGVIADLLDKSRSSAGLAKEVAAYLVATHQTKELDQLMHDVMTARAKRGIIDADVTTAFPLSQSVQTEVQQLLRQEYPKAQRLVVNSTVDPTVLSGLKVQTADKQLDETARGKLHRLEQYQSQQSKRN